MYIPNNRCRSCGHYHQYTPTGSSLVPYLVSWICLAYPCESDYHDFIPADNLEYLEYKLKEKENVRQAS